MSWTAILLLAGGAYFFKALGLLVLGPATLRGATDARSRDDSTEEDGVLLRIGKLLPPALLAALVVSQTVATGTDLVIDARLAGVAAGAVAVWRGAPFWLVLVISATTTALLRLIAG